jgi:hypothetical protein
MQGYLTVALHFSDNVTQTPQKTSRVISHIFLIYVHIVCIMYLWFVLFLFLKVYNISAENELLVQRVV